MIARESHFDANELNRLLEESLPADREQAVVLHLEQCPACQTQLEELAGAQELWKEAASCWNGNEANPDWIQKNSRSSPRQNSRSRSAAEASAENYHALTWIRGLLEPDGNPEHLGVLAGRAVHDVIGQGGMGVVLKVWDDKLNRFLAAKLLSPLLASTGVARQRFFREAQSAAAVVHPNIVPIYDICDDGPVPYILMPLLEGGSLQQKIDDEGPLPLVEVLSIGLQTAEALAAAHGQGLIHRDIKPANILLDRGGRRVLLTDFGLARTLDDATLTASGVIAGTPNYMSPEQAKGQPLDQRSDLYGLGAVMFATATGHPPVRGRTPFDILQKLTAGKTTPASEVNETLPPWFDQMLVKMLHSQRDQRFDSAETTAKVLRRCLAYVRSPTKVRLPSAVTPKKRDWTVPLVLFAAIIGLSCAVLQSPIMGTQPKPDRLPMNSTERLDNLGTALVRDNSNDLSIAPLVSLSNSSIEMSPLTIDSNKRDLNEQLDDLQRDLEALNDQLQDEWPGLDTVH